MTEAQIQRHRDYMRNYQRRWARANRAKNPKRCQDAVIKWRSTHEEAHRIISRRAHEKWAAMNRAKIHAVKHRRRERVRKVKPCDKQSANVLCQLISDAPKLKCGICGKNMPKNDRSVDHIIPLAKGGSGEIWNLRIVHLKCNLKKAHRMPDELNFSTP